MCLFFNKKTPTKQHVKQTCHNLDPDNILSPLLSDVKRLKRSLLPFSHLISSPFEKSVEDKLLWVFCSTLGCNLHTSEPVLFISLSFPGKNKSVEHSKEHFIYENVPFLSREKIVKLPQIWQHQPKIKGYFNFVFTSSCK